MDPELQVPGIGPTGLVPDLRVPYKHPLTDRLNQELQSRGFPTTRRERRKALRRLKRLLQKQQKRVASEEAS